MSSETFYATAVTQKMLSAKHNEDRSDDIYSLSLEEKARQQLCCSMQQPKHWYFPASPFPGTEKGYNASK